MDENSDRKEKMKIELASVFVEDQEKALKFYTETLGFIKKEEIPMGTFKWLTVVSPDQPDGPELSLEPNVNPAAKTFQAAIHEQGIPATSFGVNNIQKEFDRLKSVNVKFSMEPTAMGNVSLAVFEDTCGNLIQMHQKTPDS